jgi:hypothetical protein
MFFTKTKHEERSRRSVVDKGSLQAPRMFVLRKGSKSVLNTPPTIITSDLQIREDVVESKLIRADDRESDLLVYSISVSPLHGFANITSDGTLTYLSNTNFNGDDAITVSVSELHVMPVLPSLHVQKNIKITVLPQNDEPVLSFKQQYVGMQFTKNNITSEILLNGNETRHILYGVLVLDDVDTNDSVILGTRYNDTPTNAFTLEQQAVTQAADTYGSVHREYTIQHDIHESFSGLAIFAARAHDVFDGGKISFSKELRISTYVLINPCIHGVCENKTGTPCMDKSRAFTFENYRCDCFTGYRGEWCEVDINECVPNPCSVFYDCNNLIGRYKCTLNGAKTFGLAVGFIIIIAIVAVLVKRFITQKIPLNNKIGPMNIW